MSFLSDSDDECAEEGCDTIRHPCHTGCVFIILFSFSQYNLSIICSASYRDGCDTNDSTQNGVLVSDTAFGGCQYGEELDWPRFSNSRYRSYQKRTVLLGKTISVGLTMERTWGLTFWWVIAFGSGDWHRKWQYDDGSVRNHDSGFWSTLWRWNSNGYEDWWW